MRCRQLELSDLFPSTADGRAQVGLFQAHALAESAISAKVGGVSGDAFEYEDEPFGRKKKGGPALKAQPIRNPKPRKNPPPKGE